MVWEICWLLILPQTIIEASLSILFLLQLEGSHTPEPKENGEQDCLQNGLSLPIVEEGDVLSHSLEAEHRLLKAMGWQEYPENDESCLPLTEDELKEFHMRTEQVPTIPEPSPIVFRQVLTRCGGDT